MLVPSDVTGSPPLSLMLDLMTQVKRKYQKLAEGTLHREESHILFKPLSFNQKNLRLLISKVRYGETLCVDLRPYLSNGMSEAQELISTDVGHEYIKLYENCHAFSSQELDRYAQMIAEQDFPYISVSSQVSSHLL